MDHGEGVYQRWYSMTAEAVGPAAIAKGVMTADEFDTLLASARERARSRPRVVCFKLPDVWVIASR